MPSSRIPTASRCVLWLNALNPVHTIIQVSYDAMGYRCDAVTTNNMNELIQIRQSCHAAAHHELSHLHKEHNRICRKRGHKVSHRGESTAMKRSRALTTFCVYVCARAKMERRFCERLQIDVICVRSMHTLGATKKCWKERERVREMAKASETVTKKFFRFPCPFSSTCRIYLFYLILFCLPKFILFFSLPKSSQRTAQRKAPRQRHPVRFLVRFHC